MRWACFENKGSRQIGLVIDDAVHALEPHKTLLSLLGDDGEMLERAGDDARNNPRAVLPLASLTLLPPIPEPPTVRDFYAFEQHARAGRKSRGQELPEEWYQIPVFYFTNPAALIGDGAPVALPPGCAMLDYEVEVAAIIGRGGSDIAPRDADRHIIGYTILNDWSARDLQRKEMKLGLGPAKAKDFASTMGPFLVTADEIAPYRKGAAFDLSMTAAVNGVEYTRGNLADIHWSFEEMLAFASRGTRVRAGDIIGSGTCATGCILELSQTHGSERFPWLKPGDHVTVAVDRLGQISNTVHAGRPPIPLRAGLPT